MSRPTKEEYEASWRAKGFIKLDNGEWVKRANSSPRVELRRPEPKQAEGSTLVGLPQRQEESTNSPTKRITIRFIIYRVRPLDPDNAAASGKAILDGLRYARLIPEDKPHLIKFEVEQEKINHYKDQKTLIEIIYP